MRKEFFNKKENMLNIHIVNCGYEDCCPNFICPPHIRKYYLIHYVTKGCGFYEVNGHKYTVSEGDIFIIYPNEIVTYYSPDIKNTWSFCWLGFSGKNAESYFSETAIPPDTYVISLKSKRFVSNIYNCVEYVDDNKNDISQLLLNSYLLNALSLLEKHYKTKNTVSQPTEIVERAIRYIEFNYMNSITVKDLCQYLYLDRTYVYRLFKKYTGSSPEKYIINYKIRRSLDLINADKFTMTEIAEAVGINSIYYFSKLFKQVMGISPSEYKRNLND